MSRDSGAARSNATDATDASPITSAPDAREPMPRAESGSVMPEPDDDAVAIFGSTEVRTYEIHVDPDELAMLDQDPSTEAYIAGTLGLDGETHPIGFRYKGSVGAFLQPCTDTLFPGQPPGPKTGKCSIKVAFDYADDSARFYGLKKLNFHSMGRDVSMLRERLGYTLFRQMGIAAPRTAYARLVINGALEGLFLIVEQIDGRFTRARFSEGGKGNLYKEVWPVYEDPEPYRTALESNKGSETDVRAMIEWKHAIEAGGEGWADWIDRDYTMRYTAVDRVIVNDDGPYHFYCGFGTNRPAGAPVATNHNYYLYESEAAGRFWIVPWDLDLTFLLNNRVHIEPEWSAPGTCQCQFAMGFPLMPASCDPLAAGLGTFTDPYARAVDAFLTGPFASDAVEAELATWSAQIADAVDEAGGVRGAPDRAAWHAAIDELRTVIGIVRTNHGYPYSDPNMAEGH